MNEMMPTYDVIEEPRIIRVFPRKTKATPIDALAYFGPPDRHAEADEVHISCCFSYDKLFAEHLAEQWKHVAPVKVWRSAAGAERDRASTLSRTSSAAGSRAT